MSSGFHLQPSASVSGGGGGGRSVAAAAVVVGTKTPPPPPLNASSFSSSSAGVMSGLGGGAMMRDSTRSSFTTPSSLSSVLHLPSSLPVQIETSIARWFYKSAETSFTHAHQCGLLSPLWLWTHVCYNEADRLDRCVLKSVHLLKWLHRNRVDMRRVAVVCADPAFLHRMHSEVQQLREGGNHPGSPGPAARPPFGDEERASAAAATGAASGHFIDHVSILLPHEISVAAARQRNTSATVGSGDVPPSTTPSTQHSKKPSIHATYQVVVYVMPQQPSEAQADLMSAGKTEEFIASNLAAATTSFVWITDAGWTAPHLKNRWCSWGTVVDKLQQQSALSTYCSFECKASGGDGLVGLKLPICCALHPGQFELISGLHDLSWTPTFCKRACLKQHHCHNPLHVCTLPCHPTVEHRHCPYACENVLEGCEHPCQMQCGERCNCLVVMTEPLSCSHQIVVGLDPESQLPIYMDVPHAFHGLCMHRTLPCAVTVPTTCAKCLGNFSAPCHVLSSSSHSLSNKTLSCPDCVKVEAQIRSAVLAEVLVKAEQRKKEIKTAITTSVHENKKSAARGVFKVGARILIRDTSKIARPINEECDFPGKPFVDYDAPDLNVKLHNAMGIIESQHVDIDDPTELRSLVRLSCGKYVLVADGGMEFLRGDLSALTSQPQLLLCAGPSSSSTHTGTSTSTDCTSAAAGGGEDEERRNQNVKRSAMVDRWFLLMNTATVNINRIHNNNTNGPECSAGNGVATTVEEMQNTKTETEIDDHTSSDEDDGDDDGSTSIELSEVVVRVVGPDPSYATHVVVECDVLDRNRRNAAMEELLDTEGLNTTSTQTVMPRKRPRDDKDTHHAEGEGQRKDITDKLDSLVAAKAAHITVRFSVAVQDLDEIPFIQAKKSSPQAPSASSSGPLPLTVAPAAPVEVTVTHPEQQITSGVLLDLVREACQAETGGEHGGNDGVAATSSVWSRNFDAEVAKWPSIAPGEQFHVLRVVNPPLFCPDDDELGFPAAWRSPWCVLRSQGSSAQQTVLSSSTRSSAVRAQAAARRGASTTSRGALPSSSNANQTQQNHKKLVVVPLVFVAVDEVTSAMNRLDKEAQLELDRLVGERVQAYCEQRALRNDELAYYAQLAMPAVTEQLLEEKRTGLLAVQGSVYPVPSQDELLRLQHRYAKLPKASASQKKLLETKDAGQKKMESLRPFSTAYTNATKDDRESTNKYVEMIDKKAAVQRRP